MQVLGDGQVCVGGGLADAPGRGVSAGNPLEERAARRSLRGGADLPPRWPGSEGSQASAAVCKWLRLWRLGVGGGSPFTGGARVLLSPGDCRRWQGGSPSSPGGVPEGMCPLLRFSKLTFLPPPPTDSTSLFLRFSDLLTSQPVDSHIRFYPYEEPGPITIQAIIRVLPCPEDNLALVHVPTQRGVSSSLPETQERAVRLSLQLAPCDLQAALSMILGVTLPFIERLNAHSPLPPTLHAHCLLQATGLLRASSHSLCHRGSELQWRRPVQWPLGIVPPVQQSECPVPDGVGVGWAASSDASTPCGRVQPFKTEPESPAMVDWKRSSRGMVRRAESMMQ